MPETFTWDEYNASQWGRQVRPLLGRALDAVEPDLLPDQRVAIDLGCGEGVEVAALLADGWTVHAVDGDAAGLRRLAQRSDVGTTRLHPHHSAYQDLEELPAAALVHSSYALPYCPPEAFDRVWQLARRALVPGGVIACQLFGPRDGMAGTAGMTFHAEPEVRALLAGLEIVHWREEDAEGGSFSGPKHWHVFHVVARAATRPDS
ncbi:class I SAM-dependent methyltransferase [Cellulomonas sp. KRMCY2]|uniref:class I SAM-dependent methyltransferase n=1 Tax=Cellulomonas sp. KRMCY2 TaxID=1304865 RepID=UPI00045EA287|nr:class I SAM-dependent methyltransferase [Cellulomonas sp. KRMCY2]